MSDDPELGDVCPKRFGLNYDPPSIVLEYLQLSTGKLFHRRIGLRRLRKSSDPGRVAEKLRQRNKVLLEEDKVSLDQIVTLVKKLQESLKDEVKERKSQSSAKSNNNSLSAPVSVIQPVASPAKDEARKLDFDKAALSPSENQEDIPVAQDMNLNVLSTDDLNKHKAKMDVTFFKNQKKPGDTDFIYDVQVNFPESELPSGWDSDASEEVSDG